MPTDYEIVEKVYKELDSLDFRSSADKIETANLLCEKNGILMSDLIQYEMAMPEEKKNYRQTLSNPVIDATATDYYDFLNSFPKTFGFTRS